jgi:uncharacterized protein (DUF58 family)
MDELISKRIILFALAAVFLFAAYNRELDLLYVMFALLAATLILAFVLPRFSLRGVTSGRSLQSAAFEDDEIDIQVDLINTTHRNRYMIEVIDSFPAAERDLQTPMTFIARLKRKQRRRYSYKLTCYKRGEYTIGPLILKSAYPLGISSISRKIEEECPTLLVYPKVFEVSALPLRASSYMPMIGIEATSMAGGCEEFFGVREYKQGDSLKYIHWPLTAKHGRYIVKDFEVRASTEVTIFVDLQNDSDIGEGKETTLEYAVKISASAAKYALERGHTVQLIGYGDKPCIVPYGKGVNQLAVILEGLARVKADGTTPYSRMINDAAGMLRDGGTAVLIFYHFKKNTGDYLYSLSLLKAKRIRIIAVFIDSDSFMKDAKNKEGLNGKINPIAEEIAGLGEPVYFVKKGDNLQEVFSG